MNEIRILDLVWDGRNEAHIWTRHQITRAEVEEVCYGGRYLVIGPKRGGKLFAVVLAPKGAGNFYPVSARRASVKERRVYREWKAEEQK